MPESLNAEDGMKHDCFGFFADPSDHLVNRKEISNPESVFGLVARFDHVD